MLLTACGDPTGKAAVDEEAQVLRTYPVPKGQTQAIGQALNQVFATGPEGRRIGRASYELPGQLVVLAPESVQASIAESIAGIVGSSGEANAMSTASLRIWVVDGRPGPGDDADRLAVLAPAIKAISGNFPGFGFRLVDQAEIAVTEAGHESTLVTGSGNAITAQLVDSDPMTFSVMVIGPSTPDAEGLSLRSMLSLPPGELVVMASLQDKREPASTGPAPMRFLILQAVEAAR
ncbi:MAG: hypothetical protein K0M70_11930 [Arenimonas sp.]|uniref:hypothetical protein n=1 Tax=Arenimonas sp. TaxID=1872635 RepID=UPI0025BA1DC4|nr:hypothetical protein [Arenimonas sp.]MBW8368549.1 hypothetical protein [Arenimonas sp.]